jgi:CheY-like chemotaxis protein
MAHFAAVDMAAVAAGTSWPFYAVMIPDHHGRPVVHFRCHLELQANSVFHVKSSTALVLLVEDDDILRENYQTLLGAHRLAVRGCATKAEAIAAFNREVFDVIILDVTLGEEYEAGFELCQVFREKRKTTPIIFLTEHAEDADRISGLRLGAGCRPTLCWNFRGAISGNDEVI